MTASSSKYKTSATRAIHHSHTTTGSMDSKKKCTTVKKQSAKSKKVNNQMIRVDPTSVQELKQLVCDLVNCPIHVTNTLKRLTTKKTGKSYFKCTVKNCPVFCFEDKLGDYCNVLATKLSPAYK